MRALRNAAKIGSVRPVVTLRKEQTLILFDPFQRRGRVYKRKFCLSVYLSVIFFSSYECFPFFPSPFSSPPQAKYFPAQSIFLCFLLRFSFPPQAKYFSFPNALLLFLLLGKGSSLTICVFICTLQYFT